MPQRRTRTSFRKGQSGNPGGRPKIIESVREAARVHTAEAIDTLVALMRRYAEVPAVAERAAEALLDRGWGRPDVSANIKIERNVRALSTDELLADIASVRETLAGLRGATGEEAGAGEPDSVH